MIQFLSTSPTICAILIFSMFIMLIGFSLWIESKNGTSKIEVQNISKEPLKHVSSIDLRKKQEICKILYINKMKTIKAEFTYFNEKEIVEIEFNEELDDTSSQGIDSEIADHFIDWLLKKVEAGYRILPEQ